MTCNHDPLYTNDGRCMKCYPPKRAVMVKHADGTVEIEREWIVNPVVTLQALEHESVHQCGWCGEYFTGSRVDHGCPPDTRTVDDLTDTFEDSPISAMEKSYIDSFDLPAEVIAQMERSCAETASVEEYSSATEGHW